MVGIYLIKNHNEKIYIGQSWDIKRRLRHHKRCLPNGCPHLANSIKKYGFDSHEIKILHELPIDVEQEVLDRYEQFYIDTYRDCGFELMNLKEGGRGGKHHEETKRKISETKIGVLKSDETKKKMGAWQIGKKRSPQSIENMRVAKTGKKYSEEAKKNMGRKKGTKLSEQTKRKMSDKHKGKVFSDIHKERLSEAKIKWCKNNPDKVTAMVNKMHGKA